MTQTRKKGFRKIMSCTLKSSHKGCQQGRGWDCIINVKYVSLDPKIIKGQRIAELIWMAYCNSQGFQNSLN